MAMNPISTPPSVSWAQQSSRVILTFNVECEEPQFNIENRTVSFLGTCAPNNKRHEVTIPLFGEIDPEKSSFSNKGRLIEVNLTKANQDEPFWPSLTSDMQKHHWLKVDFERWQDEEDEGESGEGDDMNDFFKTKMELNDDIDDKDDASSSEEEDLPDLQ